MKSPSRATTTWRICVSGSTASSLCAKFSMITMSDGAGIGELLFQFARRVERIDVDDDQARAQRAEKRHRIGEQVRQHDGDAVARLALRFLDQERGKSPADALPLGIAHAHAETFEGWMRGMAGAGVEQHGRKRRIGIRIDAPGHARRIRGEPDRLRRAGGAAAGGRAALSTSSVMAFDPVCQAARPCKTGRSGNLALKAGSKQVAILRRN